MTDPRDAQPLPPQPTPPHATRPRGSSATAGPAGRPGRLQSLQPSALAWLTLIWVALWGDLSVANLVGGLLIGVVVCLVFPLPPLHMRLHLHPLRLLALAARFAADVVLATVHVSRVILVQRTLRNSVIEVPLSSPSDLVLTIVAQMTSLVPGSVVVEVRRSDHTLFLHVLDTPDRSAAERMRATTLELDRRVVAALGTPAVPGGAHTGENEGWRR